MVKITTIGSIFGNNPKNWILEKDLDKFEREFGSFHKYFDYFLSHHFETYQAIMKQNKISRSTAKKRLDEKEARCIELYGKRHFYKKDMKDIIWIIRSKVKS